MCLSARFGGEKFWAVHGAATQCTSPALGGWAQQVQDDGRMEDRGWMEGKWTKDGGQRMDGWTEDGGG